MIVERTIPIAAPAAETLTRVIDVPFVGSCLPGVSDVQPDGDGRYRGTFAVRVGPVQVRLDGIVSISEIDLEAQRASLRIDGTERRIGGSVAGVLDLQVEEDGEAARLAIHTELTISGKLGQFGQAVIVKKADQITEAFAEEFSRRMREDRELASRFAEEEGARSQLADAAQGASATVPDTAPGIDVSSDRHARHDTGLQVWPSAPLAGAHVMVDLLRYGRELTVVDTAEAASRGAVSDVNRLWITDAAASSGMTGAQTAGRAYIVSVAGSDPDDVARKWTVLQKADLDAPLAIALRPVAAALTERAVLSGTIDALARVSGKPIVGVATTPWSILSLAPLAHSGRLCALALVVDTERWSGHGTIELVCAAVAELRRAAIQVPVLAGIACSGSDTRLLRAAGADVALVDRYCRFTRLRRIARLAGEVRRGGVAWRG